MSFHIEFTAKNRADAEAIIDSNVYLPSPVAEFIKASLLAVKVDQPVYVKADGHLYQPKQTVRSNAIIEVRPLEFQDAPKAKPADSAA